MPKEQLIKSEIISNSYKSENSKGKMATIGNIEQFHVDGSFTEYEERMNNYLKVNKIVTEEAKAEYFIILAGPEVYTILKSLISPREVKDLKYSEIVSCLIDHFAPKVNIRVERFKFGKLSQNEGESTNEFILKLKSYAATCKFGVFLDDALADKFISGIRNKKIQQELLRMSKEDTKFSEFCSIAINIEMSENDSTTMSAGNNELNVNKIKQNNTKNSNQSSKFDKNKSRKKAAHKSKLCSRCGVKSHPESECPAKKWKCHACNKQGHTSYVCRSKTNTSQVNGINAVFSENKSCYLELKVNQNKIKMEVDTGACTTVFGIDKYRQFFSDINVEKFDNNCNTITGEKVRILGQITLEVEYRDRRHQLGAIVIDSRSDFIPVIGRSWLDEIIPEWRSRMLDGPTINKMESNSTEMEHFSQMVNKYPNIIPLDKYQEPIKNFVVEIINEKSASPIFHSAYTVPYKVKEMVELELQRLLEKKVIEKVKYSKWASPIVVVPKANKELRICVDFKKTINKTVLMDHYPIPRIDDIFASMANCTYFCVLDLSGAYQQLVVSDESRELITINTHLGLYRFTRLPFGLKTAPAIFQSVMDQILVNLNKVRCYLDDILVGGTSKSECKENLHKVLSRLNEYHVKVNITKCKILEKSVKYLGHIISENGLATNPEKLKAIVEAPEPKSVKELQSYLGLLNYYGKFIPNLSSQIVVLYKLLEKASEFVWTDKCREVFEKSKKLLLENQVLELYDPNKPILISADASPYGVGAVLSHMVNGVEKPVLFASSTLSPAERNYSQTHREALAIIYAVKKFHKYIWGLKFTIYTDHQALREVFNPMKSTPAVAVARLHRWANIMSMYDYKIVYRSAKQMQNADALSRLPVDSNTDIAVDSIKFLNLTDNLPVVREEIQRAQENDTVMSKVFNYVMFGWPNKSQLTEEFMKFYNRRSSLACEDGQLYYLSRIVIPKELQSQILKSLHECHVGIVKMKMMARSYVWWINIDKDIEEFVSRCSVCQQTQKGTKIVTTTAAWPASTYPFERIHLDFFFFQNEIFLILVDSFSKFVDVVNMNKKTDAPNLINKLVDTFLIFGFPKIIVTDNGPPFNSLKFSQFAKQYDIELLKSPPYNPQSNGLAERNVQTVKQMLNKSLIDGELQNKSLTERVKKFLMFIRNVPAMSTKVTPSELILSFKPKISLDILNNYKSKKL